MKDFKQARFKWYRPNHIEGSVKVKDFNVAALAASKGIKISPPKEIHSMAVGGNLQVKRIYGIDLDDFVKNIVHINDTASMKKVTFGKQDVFGNFCECI